MRDKQTLIWLYQHSRTTLWLILTLMIGYALYAVCGILFALTCRSLIDGAVVSGKSTLLLKSCMVLVVLIAQFLLRILCGKLGMILQSGLEIHFKTKLLSRLLHKDYVQISRYHSGELMNRLTGDITIVSEGVATILPNLMGLLTKLLCAIFVLYSLDRVFTLMFVLGGILLFLTTKVLRGKLKSLHKTMQEKDGLFRSFMQEVLESMIVVKTFGVEQEMNDRADGLGRELYQAKLKKNNVSILANSGLSFIFSLGYLYALVWSSFGLMAKTLSFGTLTAILQLVGQVQMTFSGLSGLLPKIYSVMASTERLIELEKLPDEPAYSRQTLPIAEIYNTLHSLSLQDVSFGYDRELIFNHANLNINKGDFVVLSGQSGIGKSTLFLLLLSVLSPNRGTLSLILKNGEQMALDQHTRKLFAYIPQGYGLLSGTIRQNIAFVNPKQRRKTSWQRQKLAVRMSLFKNFLRDLIRSLANEGWDYPKGKCSDLLSQGQMQRLAIARAILSEAPILLLDEATSALDQAIEEKLLKNLKQITDKTCIMISHKKAAFSVCNKAIHIESSQIITMERSYHHACHLA